MNHTILFDLDGTLINTAPDFVAIMNAMRAERELGPVDEEEFIAQIARGSAAMTQYGLNLTEEDPEYASTLEEFYQLYLENMGVHAEPYAGIEELITHLDENQIKWGVVTNRQLAFIPKILKQFDIHDKTHCIVGSDSTPHRKPHPAPLLHAAKELGSDPEHCFYVGDFHTDIEAGNAANMKTIAVSWGYHDGLESLVAAQPDHLIDKPEDIIAIVKNA